MAKTWFEETLEIIKDHKKETSNQEIKFLGKTITVFPEVFSPKYFTDAAFFAEAVPTIVGKGSFCEVGVGTGVVSLFTALNGSSNIAGTDINPEAIKNTKYNFEKFKIAIDLYEGDVLDTVPKSKKFDFLFWNHPFNRVDFEVQDHLMKSVLDTHFRGLEKYFSDAFLYLNDGGTLILGSGELANQELVQDLAQKYGWKLQKTQSRNSKVRVSGDMPMELYIHEFKK